MTWRRRPTPRLRLGHTRLLPFLHWPVTLGPHEIASHKHVMGLTGQGKSKLLASLFVQLVAQGTACTLIDPDADLALDCLAGLLDRGVLDTPATRAKVWYIDFSQRERYLPFKRAAPTRRSPHHRPPRGRGL